MPSTKKDTSTQGRPTRSPVVISDFRSCKIGEHSTSNRSIQIVSFYKPGR